MSAISKKYPGNKDRMRNWRLRDNEAADGEKKFFVDAIITSGKKDAPQKGTALLIVSIYIIREKAERIKKKSIGHHWIFSYGAIDV